MQPQTDEQRGKRACALTARDPSAKPFRDSWVVLRRDQLTAGKTGPQPRSGGARAPELIPPMQSVPRRRVEGT